MADDLFTLIIVDGATEKPTPARVEVIDAEGRSYVARDALKVPGDCADHPEPRWLSLDESLQVRPRSVENLHTRTTQLYWAGRSEIPLAPGPHTIRATKGPEYRVASLQLEVTDSGALAREVRLGRWVDMATRGWISGADPVPIARHQAERNR